MAKSDMIQVRVDPQVKREADALFAELGIPTATAINLFLKTAIREGGIPFAIRAGSDFSREPAPLEEEEPDRAAKKAARKEKAAIEKAAKEKAVKERKAKEKNARDKAPDGSSVAMEERPAEDLPPGIPAADVLAIP